MLHFPISCVPHFWSKTSSPSCLGHLLPGRDWPSSSSDVLAVGKTDADRVPLSFPRFLWLPPFAALGLSVPFSLHFISFSSKNRSFNLGRTINWDEKKDQKYGEAFQLLYQARSNWHCHGRVFTGEFCFLPPCELRENHGLGKVRLSFSSSMAPPWGAPNTSQNSDTKNSLWSCDFTQVCPRFAPERDLGWLAWLLTRRYLLSSNHWPVPWKLISPEHSNSFKGIFIQTYSHLRAKFLKVWSLETPESGSCGIFVKKADSQPTSQTEYLGDANVH